MYKLVVLSVLLAVVSARPGYLGHYPAAVSHVSRVDIHSKPVIAGYGSPYYGGLGLGYGAGYGGAYGLGHTVPLPVAHSYSNRVDIHHDAPIISGYGHSGYYGGAVGYPGYGWDY